MIKQLAARFRVINWGQSVRATLIMALLLPLLAVAPAHKADAAQRIQPALLEMVMQHPDSTVGVIVQKTVRDDSVEQSVVRLGGTITKDLSIISAFAAQLPAKSVKELNNVPGVRWVSLDSRITSSDCNSCVDVSNLQNAYIRTIGANRVWNSAPYLQGQGIGVAIIDTGIKANQDFRVANGNGNGGGSRVITATNFMSATVTTNDQYGHGTHVAGIIGGNGNRSDGRFIGVAPSANLLNLKVSDRSGAANSSDVVSALQWVLNNKSAYNIRVVNLSFISSVPESYLVSPLDAAVEILWFNGVVVVAAAGNTGASGGVQNAPANDPFIITVGATNDQGTADPSDDTLAPFSSYGTTQDGFSKPDLVAPGTNIVSVLASTSATLISAHPDHIVNNDYFRMSGTSMAAPMVAGAVALLLQDEPNLNPDQVKYRLMATTRPFTGPGSGAGYLNVYGAVNGTTTATANTNTTASQLLWSGNQPVNWGSVNWGSVNWGSVNWGSVNWGSVNWGSVNWGSVNWDQ